MRTGFCIALICFTFFNKSLATLSDSVRHKSNLTVFTPRFNTLNIAPISGSIVNNHVNFDFAMVYTRNRFMWTLVNGVDLEDLHSNMNYFFTNVRYKFNLTKHFGVSPFLAYYSEHSHQLIDPISDANSGMLFTYQNKSLTVEGFVLIVRLTHDHYEKDLINRFEIRYKFQSVTLSGFVFQNTPYYDNRSRVAVGFKAIMSEFKLFSKVNARTELTGSFKVYESPETTNLSGVFLSLAFPLVL